MIYTPLLNIFHSTHLPNLFLIYMNCFFTRKSVIIFSFLIIRLSSFSQNEPVSQAANSMVDLLTGDFTYSLPVMTVTGPNGENVPITFSYHGGIRMDDEASWLDWAGITIRGEITRSLCNL